MNESAAPLEVSVHGTVGLTPLVTSTAIPIFTELIRLCHNSHLTLDEAVAGLRASATELVRAMALERRALAEELGRELRTLGASGGAEPASDPDESLRRARTRLKTRWHRGDDEAVVGDLYEFEMQSLRRLERVLQSAVLPRRCRPLMARLRETLRRDCAALERLAITSCALPEAPDDGTARAPDPPGPARP